MRLMAFLPFWGGPATQDWPRRPGDDHATGWSDPLFRCEEKFSASRTSASSSRYRPGRRVRPVPPSTSVGADVRPQRADAVMMPPPTGKEYLPTAQARTSVAEVSPPAPPSAAASSPCQWKRCWLCAWPPREAEAVLSGGS